MALLSFQILIINFIVAGLITAITFFTYKKIRTFNPFLIFIISSVGTFLGTMVAVIIPGFSFSFDSMIINNLILSIPGVSISILFIYVWFKGSKTEGYI